MYQIFFFFSAVHKLNRTLKNLILHFLVGISGFQFCAAITYIEPSMLAMLELCCMGMYICIYI